MRHAYPQDKLKELLMSGLAVNSSYRLGNTKSEFKYTDKKKLIIPEEMQEPFFDGIIKHIPAALAIFDNDLNYLVASARWMEQTQLPSDKIVGRNMYEVVPDIPQKWKNIHARALKGEHLKSEEDTFKRKTGKIEWFRWEILPWYRNEDEIGGVVLFVEQVTNRKQLETKMKKTIDALNQSNAELARFAHICAHDLNEPLRTISNYSELLSDEIQDALTEESKRYLSNIYKSVKHMSNLINGVLAYSQLDIQQLRKRTLPFLEIADNVILTLQNVIKESGAQIDVKCNATEIYADAALVAQVLQNLINNSLKYNNNTEKPLIKIVLQDKGRFSLISVQDNGIGIESKHHKSIFRIFNRLHSNTEYTGTGIGLCTCKKIVETHGGKIWVESPPEGGSIFYFSLPKKV